ncbi:exopolyphosphatase [Oceanobacillus sp. CFH 90083]|uniref:exopolyphosphatase n=1 Tax=Oceanobacillus sp. CFH 90083 TaxID=2592336 RepID=UPI00128C8086|nr:exopolyphosphatase [Oceanobacillus sp. CFH 90083]
MKKQNYAIIDIGSNTIRLVIYEKTKGNRLKEIENVKASSRLRTFLEEDNTLNQAGIDRLIDTLKSFQEVLATYTLQDTICAATAAIRQAENKQEIETQIVEKTGLNIRILSEEEEAYYGYLAVIHSTSLTEGITVDIGGGSTEVTYFKGRELKESHSFPFGALTLKDFFARTVPTTEELTKLRQYLKEQFATLPWLENKEVKLIAIGGSARNLAQVHQNLKSYPLAGLHEYQMFQKDIMEVSHYLTSIKPDKLTKVDGLSKDRADIIIPAIEVFHCLYQTVQAESFVLSRKGLRDGVLYEHLAKESDSSLFPHVLEESIRELVNDYDLNREHIRHVQNLTEQLFDFCKDNGLIRLDRQDRKLLKMSSFLFNLGEYIDSESSSQHTFYLLANRTIDGLEHRERLKLALVASYKNKTVFKQFIQPYKSWFLKEERQKLLDLGALLKFTYCLDATKRQIVEKIDFHLKKKKAIIRIYTNANAMPEEYQAEKQKKHLEKAIGKELELEFITLR